MVADAAVLDEAPVLELAVLLLLLLPILGTQRRATITTRKAGGAVAFTKEDIRPPRDFPKEEQMTFVQCLALHNLALKAWMV